MLLLFLFSALPAHGQGCGAQECVFQYRGALQQSQIVADEDTYAKDLELGDVDNDGWLDLYLVVKQPTIALLENIDQLYLSRGTPSKVLNFALDLNLMADAFEYRPRDQVFGVAFDTVRGYDAELADLDLDGHLDVVRPDMAGILKVLWGTGQRGSLSQPVFSDVTDVLLENGGDPNHACTFAGLAGGTYDDVALADFDHDGDFDIVVGQYNLCGHNLLIRNEQKMFCQAGVDRSFDVLVPEAFIARNTHSVSVGDADRDGNYDVLLAHSPKAGFKPRAYYGDDNDPFLFDSASSATFEDVDDSRDLVTVADFVGSAPASGCGLGLAESQADLDGDQLPDVFFGQPTQIQPLYGAYFNALDPNGPPLDPLRYPPYEDWTPGPVALAFSNCYDCLYDARYADLDLDGRVEAVTVTLNNAGQQVTEMEVFEVMPGNPSQLVSETDALFPEIEANQGGIAVDLGDLDNDGDQDLVLGGFFTHPSSGEHFSAAHLYENRTLTRLTSRAVDSGFLDLVAIRTLTAGGPGTVLDGSVQATLRAGEEIVWQDGFTASANGGGQVIACIFGPDCQPGVGP